MATQPITVQYAELPGSPEIDWTDDGYTETRTLKCAWSDRIVLARQLRGGRFGLLRYAPHASNIFPAAVVKGVKIAPFFKGELTAGDTTAEASYDEAKLTVTYRVPEDQPPANNADGTETLLEQTFSPSKEFLTVPGSELFFHADGAGPDGGQGRPLGDQASPGIPITIFEWDVTLRDRDSVPADLLTKVQKTNQSSMTSQYLGLAFGPEQVLLDDFTPRQTVDTEGNATLDVTVRLLVRLEGWNKQLNIRTGQWSDIYLKGETTPFKQFPPTNLIDSLGAL
jgi:hypothetical protein